MRTNEIWIERLSASDPRQGDALTELRSHLMTRLVRAFHGRAGVDDALLEDAVQQALVKILHNLDRFRGRSRFTTWGTSIAVRTTLTELRRRRWKDVSLEQVLGEGSGGAEPVANDPGPEKRFAREALHQVLYRVLETDLTQRQRDVLLAELRGLPQEEIGRRMGSNRNAIYKLTHDARKRLRKGLEAKGYTVADLTGAGER